MSRPMYEQQKYVDIIRKIGESYAEIKKVRPLSASETAYFRNEFSISASHNSNAIEGNTFTFDETKLLIERGIVTGAHSLRESEDILGYKQAFDHLYASVKDGVPITQEFIKRLHGFVLRGDAEAGVYRKIQNYIGSPTHVVFTPCPPENVPACMGEYVSMLQADGERMTAFVERGEWSELFHMLAKHHIEFEHIHPFTDGNGRTGRLLLSYELISVGMLPVDIRYENRSRYYAAIAAYRDKEKYSTRSDSKTEKLAKLLAESELDGMQAWLCVYSHCT